MDNKTEWVIMDNLTAPTDWFIDNNGTNYYNRSSDGEFINLTIFGNRTIAINRPASIGLFYWLTLEALRCLNFYYLGTILVVGVLGNAFNFFQFLFTRNKLNSPSYYLATLSLADSVFLFTFLTVWISHFDISFYLWPRIYYILVYLSSVSSCLSGKSFIPSLLY